MELQNALEQRRSVRNYNRKKVPHEYLCQMIDAAILAPTWKNSQVIRYHVVENQMILEKVKQTLASFNYENVKDAPVLIVSSIVQNRSGFERDGTPSTEVGNEWGFYDSGLHHMNLLLKATELGLSTLVMGIRDAQKLKEILSIEENEAITSIIAVGYSDFHPEKPKRKTVADITKFY